MCAWYQFSKVFKTPGWAPQFLFAIFLLRARAKWSTAKSKWNLGSQGWGRVEAWESFLRAMLWLPPNHVDLPLGTKPSFLWLHFENQSELEVKNLGIHFSFFYLHFTTLHPLPLGEEPGCTTLSSELFWVQLPHVPSVHLVLYCSVTSVIGTWPKKKKINDYKWNY